MAERSDATGTGDAQPQATATPAPAQAAATPATAQAAAAAAAPAFSDASPPGSLAMVRLSLPPFWHKNPRVWFAQVEAQFSLNHITAEATRYRHLVSSLSSEVVERVDDILEQPLGATPYTRLKTAILERTMASERARLQQLLTAEELGDRRPSQMLHSMRQLMGEHASASQTPILRELFLQRLPHPIRLVLAAAEDMPVERLADLADKVHEVSSPTVATATTQDTAMARLEHRMEELAASVANLRASRPRPPRRRTASRSRRDDRQSLARSPSRSPSASARSPCWYHRAFGDRARKCTPPCSWSGNGARGH